MAKKRKLSDLIGEETQVTETSANQSYLSEVSDSKSDKVTNSQANKVTELQTTKVTDSSSSELSDNQTVEVPNQQSLVVPNSQSNEVSNSEATAVPKYLTLVRKESRLREDQLDSLTSLTRSLNRKRKGTGERITENTLIRVAVDLLMNQSDELKGTTEQELLASVGLD